MPYTFILADVHLQAEDSHPINQAFYTFLEKQAPKTEAIYILGDLFEMWVGDDLGLETYATVINKFKALTDSGVPIYLQYGNRDFLMRKSFWQATGITPITEPDLVNFYGFEAILLHGDALCTDDKGYQRMRRVFRNPLISWLFLRLSKEKRKQIGENMRNKSKTHSQNKAENIMDVNSQAVLDLFAKFPNCENMIHGHTHRPACHQLASPNLKRWVLGDWRPEAQIIKASESGFEFMTIDAPLNDTTTES